MDLKRTRIAVIPVGDVPDLAPKVVAAHITGYLDLTADVLPAIELPQEAFDARRLQYNAGRMLAFLESTPLGNFNKIIGVLSVDMFVPIFTHVFGEARQGSTWALVSLFRLMKHADGSTPPDTLLYERSAKVAMHELGHLFDLYHCQDSRCLMHFSGGLDDLDRLPLYFCRYCRQYFREAAFGPTGT